MPQDGYITTAELIAFFGETGTKKCAVKNANYWLKEIDGYGENDGYITEVGWHVALHASTVAQRCIRCWHGRMRCWTISTR